MKREYSKEDYLAKIAYLKELMPDISLSTDIIVGFPGETDNDFEETLGVLNDVRFSNIFSFRYSTRPRSAASRMEDNVPFDVKRRRLVELQNFQKNIQLELNRTFIGRTIKVLCLGRSKKDAHVYSGRNEGYQVANFSSSRDVIGRFVEVEVLSCGPYSLRGEARG
jgi:tRNA-2-methylthio-N6-dimethylallyladenosine synthase